MRAPNLSHVLRCNFANCTMDLIIATNPLIILSRKDIQETIHNIENCMLCFAAICIRPSSKENTRFVID